LHKGGAIRGSGGPAGLVAQLGPKPSLKLCG
jgi:hypothetical protein